MEKNSNKKESKMTQVTVSYEKVRDILVEEFNIWGEAAKVTDKKLLEETFEDVQRVHDWRNYVGVYRLDRASLNEWISLDPIVRLVRFCKDFSEASREQWD